MLFPLSTLDLFFKKKKYLDLCLPSSFSMCCRFCLVSFRLKKNPPPPPQHFLFTIACYTLYIRGKEKLSVKQDMETHIGGIEALFCNCGAHQHLFHPTASLGFLFCALALAIFFTVSRTQKNQKTVKIHILLYDQVCIL